MHFYFIGIKGAGMSALANILVDLGHKVSGVDYSKKYFTEATFRSSIDVETFGDYHLKKEYFYVIGNAFRLSHVTDKIRKNNYNYEFYPMFLEKFFNIKKIGISGSHGKTTTTHFAAQLINRKINVLVGDGNGSGNKDSDYLLFEACEYQNHFHNYTFEYLVILNIDYDHPDFFKTKQEYVYSFQKAALKAKTLIVNYDDVNCRKLIHKNKITFGYDENADVVISKKDNIVTLRLEDIKYEFEFNHFGKHMTYNLAAAFIVAFMIEGNNINIKNIKNLTLPARRMTEFKLRNDLILVNDYAHHPTEISVVLNSFKLKYPGMKLIVIYQGHTHSRTKTFLPEYIQVLKEADEVYIMSTFSSVRETDEESWLLADSFKEFKRYDRSFKEKILQNKNSVILFLGAGDIDSEFIFFK